MKIVDFYLGKRGNTNGDTLEEILKWTDDRLEVDHDWVQWVFPSNEPSMLNGDAPVLTLDEAAEFLNSKELRSQVIRAFTRVLSLFDFKYENDKVVLKDGVETPWWLRGEFNHNCLRMTRMIKSLRLVGLQRLATAVFEAVRPFQHLVSSNTWKYWDNASRVTFWVNEGKQAERLKAVHDGQVDSAYQRWKNDPLLEGFSEDQAKVVAVALENQKYHNEKMSTDPEFWKVTLSIIPKIFKDFVGFDMVSIQPMLAPNGNIFYSKYKFHRAKSEETEPYVLPLNEDTSLDTIQLEVQAQSIASRTRTLPIAFKERDWTQDWFVDWLAGAIQKSIVYEISRDLLNNAGTTAKKEEWTEKDSALETYHENFYFKFVSLSDIIHRKTLRKGANWFLTGKKLAEKIRDCSSYNDWKEFDPRAVRKVGLLNQRWKMLVDPDFAENQLLFGVTGPMIESYIYAPFIPISNLVRNGNGECSVLMRYGKVLPASGSKAYAKLIFEEKKV